MKRYAKKRYSKKYGKKKYGSKRRRSSGYSNQSKYRRLMKGGRHR